MRAFLYAGGPVYPEFITEHPKADDLRIAADSGLRAADALSDRSLTDSAPSEGRLSVLPDSAGSL